MAEAGQPAALSSANQRTVRVVIADDHPVVREGLRSFLASRPGIEIVGDADDADSAVAAASELRPDVVIVDLFMPGDGIEAIRRMQELPSPPRALVLTSFASDEKVVPALRAGAAGYLLKDVDPFELEAAVRTVARGGTLLAATATQPVISAVRDGDPPQDEALAELTEREREVLDCLARGLTNREIAAELYVSEKTVKTHVSSILMKLHVADRTQAAIYGLRHGFGD